MEKDEFRIDFEEDKRIDENNLHLEWLNQSDVVSKYIFYYARRKADQEQAAARLEYVKSDLENKLRKYPDRYGLLKATDQEVKNAIGRQQEYQDAYKQWIDADYEATVAYSALITMQNRKKLLEGLNDLYRMGYFSIPDAARNIVEDRKFWEKKNKRKEHLNDEISGSLNPED
jgi:hypothetical protein